jgi:predicted PurR-regulated permease PerM
LDARGDAGRAAEAADHGEAATDGGERRRPRLWHPRREPHEDLRPHDEHAHIDAARANAHPHDGDHHVSRDEDHDGARRRTRLVQATPTVIALGVAGGLILAQVVTAVGGRLQGILSMLVISLFLSFAMEPAVQWMARLGLRRGFGTWIVFLGALLGLVGIVAAVVPLVVDQVRNLVESGPALLDELAARAQESLPGESGDAAAEWLDEQARALPAQLPQFAGEVGRGVLGFGQTLLGVIFQALTVALVVFYLVADGPKLRARLARRLPPRDQVRVLGLWELAIAKTGGYVYSRALTAVVSAAFHVVVFTLLGLDYALALGVWVGVISAAIPAVGTYLAGALPLVVGLASSTGLAIAVLVAITLYQQVENYLIVPRITATTLELHPAVAFIAVIGGAALAGATGALLALPATAIAAALIAASGEEYDVLEHSLLGTGRADAAELVESAWPHDDEPPDAVRERHDAEARDTDPYGEEAGG